MFVRKSIFLEFAFTANGCEFIRYQLKDIDKSCFFIVIKLVNSKFGVPDLAVRAVYNPSFFIIIILNIAHIIIVYCYYYNHMIPCVLLLRIFSELLTSLS